MFSWCKDCEKEYQDKWYEHNRSKKLQYTRKNYLKRLYGMTLEEYDALAVSQDHRCAICGSEHPCNNKSRFSVDHDHKTGKVRGLLCDDCNNMLGRAKDDPAILESAIRYLRKQSE